MITSQPLFSLLQISLSQVQDREITFSWNPGNDGYAPLRYYLVQYSENNGPWIMVPAQVDPTFTSYTMRHLQPFTIYKFRIQAVNDIGPSGWSEESMSCVFTHGQASKEANESSGHATAKKDVAVITTGKDDLDEQM